MTLDQEDAARPEQQEPFYLILGELTDSEPTASEVSMDEVNEIEQIGRIAIEVSDDQPIFMTST
jgi:hypothetical protein